MTKAEEMIRNYKANYIQKKEYEASELNVIDDDLVANFATKLAVLVVSFITLVGISVIHERFNVRNKKDPSAN